MLNNNVFDDCEYIQGRKITIEEEEIINNLIKYNENEDKTNNIFSIFPTQIIFKENNSITWNINNYEVVTHKKKIIINLKMMRHYIFIIHCHILQIKKKSFYILKNYWFY